MIHMHNAHSESQRKLAYINGKHPPYLDITDNVINSGIG